MHCGWSPQRSSTSDGIFIGISGLLYCISATTPLFPRSHPKDRAALTLAWAAPFEGAAERDFQKITPLDSPIGCLYMPILLYVTHYRQELLPGAYSLQCPAPFNIALETSIYVNSWLIAQILLCLIHIGPSMLSITYLRSPINNVGIAPSGLDNPPG